MQRVAPSGHDKRSKARETEEDPCPHHESGTDDVPSFPIDVRVRVEVSNPQETVSYASNCDEQFDGADDSELILRFAVITHRFHRFELRKCGVP